MAPARKAPRVGQDRPDEAVDALARGGESHRAGVEVDQAGPPAVRRGPSRPRARRPRSAPGSPNPRAGPRGRPGALDGLGRAGDDVMRARGQRLGHRAGAPAGWRGRSGVQEGHRRRLGAGVGRAAGGEDQGVAGAGGRDVEEAEGLGGLLALLGKAVDRPAETLGGLAVGLVVAGRADQGAEVGIEGDGAWFAGGLAVEVRQDDDREFQPLGLVDRHQADAPPFLLGGRRLLLPRGTLEVGAEPGDEVGQREAPLAVEPPGQADELPHVRPLAGAQGLAEQAPPRIPSRPAPCRCSAAIGSRSFNSRHASEQGMRTVELRAVGRRDRLDPRSTLEVPGEVVAEPGGQPVEAVVAEAEEGAAQDAGQREGVGRVLDRREQVDEVDDLLLGEVGRTADDVVIQPLGRPGPPRTGRRRSVSGRGGRRRPRGRGGRTRLGVADWPAAASRDGPGGGRSSGPPRAGARGRRGAFARVATRALGPEELDGGGSPRGRGALAAAEGLARVGEGLGEEGVDEVEDARDAPEILGQEALAPPRGTRSRNSWKMRGSGPRKR